MLFSLQNKSNGGDHLIQFSKEHVFLKEYFLFVNIKSMHEPSSLKQVLIFTKLNKFWLFINETILGLDGSKLKSASITLLS